MADFSALIAQIEAYVKQNGNNEITGNGLQSILVGMVNALGTEAITALQGDLADEVTARQNADGTLQQGINTERQQRQDADGAINAKIPAEASSSNKLADKAFVTGLTTALQNAVNAIKADIENGYVYAGIATPSGTPVSGKVFYLARQAGTYTNFGGLTLTEGVNVLKYNGTAWSQEQLITIADIYRNPLMGYYECDTAGATAAKTVAATGYVLPTTGGSVKIKMANRNTVANATLNINSTGAKPLFYNGERAGVGNTWDTNEIVEVFYDGTNYQAYNVAGSNGDGVFDISAYNLTDGLPTVYADLRAALGTNGANVPEAVRAGGMQVKFIQGSVQSSDNKYVQYRLMANTFSTTVSDWQGVDDYPVAWSPNLVKGSGLGLLYNITEITPELISGYFIRSNGTVVAESHSVYSEPFLLKKNQTVVLYAKGYSNYFSMVSKVLTEDSKYLPLLTSKDDVQRNYCFQNKEEDMYVAVSYEANISQNPKIVIIDSTETFDVDNYQSYGVITDGKYVKADGNYASDSGSRYITGITLEKGETIYLTVAGYNKSYSIFSEVLTEGESYRPLVTCIDSTERLYMFTNLEKDSMNIAISYDKNHTTNHNIYKSKSTLAKNLALNLSSYQVRLPNVSFVTGKTIWNDGTVKNDSCKYSTPFLVKHGEAIYLRANEYLNYYSAISKVITPNSQYEPCVICAEGVTEYYYINKGEDANFAVCGINNNNLTFSVITSPAILPTVDYIDKKSTELTDNGYYQLAYAGIPIMGIIGDSLSSGVTYMQDNTQVTDYSKAWWRVLERNSGANYKNFCKGGLTTRSWLVDSGYGLPVALLPDNKCCAYVIALGVNDAFSLGLNYLGTIEDINDSDYTQNADTFYGNYGRIIQNLTSAVSGNIKFFLCTIPRKGTENTAFNEAIRQIAAHFSNCYLVDLFTDYYDIFNYGFIQQHKFGGGHHSAAAYAVIGKIFESAISTSIRNNAVDFRYIQFALE